MQGERKGEMGRGGIRKGEEEKDGDLTKEVKTSEIYENIFSPWIHLRKRGKIHLRKGGRVGARQERAAELAEWQCSDLKATRTWGVSKHYFL